MPDRLKSRLHLARWFRRVAGLVVPSLSPEAQARRSLYEEILRQLNRNQSLEELLQLPAQLCEALHLSAFRIFLFAGSGYVLTPADGQGTAFPASCSTVLRMKRERRPAQVVPPGATGSQADGWQLLATPDELTIFERLATELLVPLDGRTRLAGFASLSHTVRRPFTRAEKRFLRDLGAQLGRALETALFVDTLSGQAVERARLSRELELAREVQERLLPFDLPRMPGLEIAALYQSAERVGGDYYDAFPTTAGRLCVVVGDVSGKGISAALVMASLRATLHALMLQPGLSPETMLAHCNALLYQASSASRYATLFLCLYDPERSVLHYTNAGHNPPLLRGRDGAIRPLDAGGPVLGLFPTVEYVSESVPFLPGDILLAFTDGVTEAMDVHQAEWGEPGLVAAWQGFTAGTAEALVAHLFAGLRAFRGAAPQNDDITLLVLKRH